MHMYVDSCVCVYTEYGKGHVAEKFPRRVKLLLICCGLSHSVFLTLSIFPSLAHERTHAHPHIHTSPLSLLLSAFLSLPLSLSLSVSRVPECLAFSYTHDTLEVLLLLSLSLSLPVKLHSRDSRRPFTNHRYMPNPIAQLYIYVYTPSISVAGSSTALASFHFQD